jgi:hypothetical protein
MKIQCKLALILFGFTPFSVWAATHYVWQSSPGPAPPFLTWATAATNIQSAVDAAGAGDEIVVTNGTYAAGSRGVYSTSYGGTMTKRVAVDKPLALRSVNGPQTTVIDGGSAVGCVYLTNGATLFGFTLTNGYADTGGGVYCESSAVLSNCVLSANSAWNYGGGAYGGILNNCALTGNSAGEGYGGGAADSTLNNCALTGNTAWYGGGANSCMLNNCTLTGNSASDDGGGAADSTLNNCALTGNTAWDGGGANSCMLNNCILYYNNSTGIDANYDPSSTLNYCCSTPLPGRGVGNISADPQLADLEHLSASSPCIGAGSAAYASGTDIDGQPWANPPSIGCDEFYAGAINGPLSVAILADYTNVATGFVVNFTAQIIGHPSTSTWDFGDGSVVSNRPYAAHAWTAMGDYRVILRAYNDTHPGGLTASATVHVIAQPVHYVAVSSPSPLAPYSSWATAATNIQDAVDAASVPGALVLVSNAVYQTVVAVTRPVTVRSANGPDVTVIDGGGVAQCAYLTSDAVLVGFTLTNGSAWNGGGVYCESTSAVLSNCVLTGNSATGWRGGGPGRRGLWRHAEQLHADRQLGQLRRRGLWRHAEQLHSDRELRWARWRCCRFHA